MISLIYTKLYLIFEKEKQKFRIIIMIMIKGTLVDGISQTAICQFSLDIVLKPFHFL